MDKYQDEMVEFNKSVSDGEFLRLLFYRFGITNNHDIEALQYLDTGVAANYLVELMLSPATEKFLNFIRK